MNDRTFLLEFFVPSSDFRNQNNGVDGFDIAFARADIMKLAGITSSPAGSLLDKLKEAGLVEPVVGKGKGKYKFIMPKE